MFLVVQPRDFEVGIKRPVDSHRAVCLDHQVGVNVWKSETKPFVMQATVLHFELDHRVLDDPGLSGSRLLVNVRNHFRQRLQQLILSGDRHLMEGQFSLHLHPLHHLCFRNTNGHT